MKLYGSYTSPFVRHCRIVLARTGQSCDLVDTDYAASAEWSPACRVPFLSDGDRMLNDSASILRHLRERAGQAFFEDLTEFDFFLLVNTALDSSINLFLLEKDGLTPEQIPYLGRQRRRVAQCLDWLEKTLQEQPPPADGDGLLRLGCFLSWALFRERLTLEGHPALAEFQRQFELDPTVADTHPEHLAA